MTTEEATQTLNTAAEYYNLSPTQCDAWATIKAALARVTAERDKLIEAWPVDFEGTVDWTGQGEWRVYREDDLAITRHPTREAAVRAAAGLDAGEGV